LGISRGGDPGTSRGGGPGSGDCRIRGSLTPIGGGSNKAELASTDGATAVVDQWVQRPIATKRRTPAGAGAPDLDFIAEIGENRRGECMGSRGDGRHPTARGAFYYYKANYGRLLSNSTSTIGFFKIVFSSKINCYNRIFKILILFFIFSTR
jgi:hypothetical protein